MRIVLKLAMGTALAITAFYAWHCATKKQSTHQGPPSAKDFSMNKTTLTLLGLKYPFTLAPLPYDYKALEPHIDEATMRIHHTKHHQAYIDNANKALEEVAELQKYTIEELLTNLPSLPESVRERLRNHAGGHFNHTIFWQMMVPNAQPLPTEKVAHAINEAFGSFDAFKELFNKAAQSRFGSGWAWLCINKEKKLVVTSTANQDTPLAAGLFPILGLDVWEHAYYLKYQNKRMDYITAWWAVINWPFVEKLFTDGLKAVE